MVRKRKGGRRSLDPTETSVQVARQRRQVEDDDSLESIDEVITTKRVCRSHHNESQTNIENNTRHSNTRSVTNATPQRNRLLEHDVPTTISTAASQASNRLSAGQSSMCSDITDTNDRKDYRLMMAPKSADVVVRSVVNTVLFHKMKFFTLSDHVTFSTDQHTVSGLLVAACNVSANDAPEWWHNVQNKVGRLLTDHRNNVIKSIRKHYIGKSQYLNHYHLT